MPFFFPLKFGRIETIFCKFLSKLKDLRAQLFFLNMRFNLLLKTWMKSDKYIEFVEIIPCCGVIKKRVSYYLLNPELKSWEPDPQSDLKCILHMKCPSVTNTSCSLLWDWYDTTVHLWGLKWTDQGNARIRPACEQKLQHFPKSSSIIWRDLEISWERGLERTRGPLRSIEMEKKMQLLKTELTLHFVVSSGIRNSEFQKHWYYQSLYIHKRSSIASAELSIGPEKIQQYTHFLLYQLFISGGTCREIFSLWRIVIRKLQDF